MGAQLLRNLSQAVFGALALRCSVCAGGQAKYKKLMKEVAEDESICIAAKAQYSCSNGIKEMMMMMMKKKKEKKKVPKGYLPVLIVGNVDDDDEEEQESGAGGRLYVIKVCLLGHPLLDDILKRSLQQFGDSMYAGVLKLPCDSHTFEHLLALIT